MFARLVVLMIRVRSGGIVIFVVRTGDDLFPPTATVVSTLDNTS